VVRAKRPQLNRGSGKVPCGPAAECGAAESGARLAEAAHVRLEMDGVPCRVERANG
jgi:hypothetical protein